DGDCAADERCDFEACQPVTCSADDECALSWRCIASRCIPPLFCGSDADCPFPGMVCRARACIVPGSCASEAECPRSAPVCIDGACVPLPPPSCRQDRDCPGELECNLGYCELPARCPDGVTCTPAQVCEDGRCVPPPSARARASAWRAASSA